MADSYWWKRAVFYEVYIDKFAGTFSGAAEKFDYLKNLGIDCIHILPHYPSPMVDDGYDVSNYLDIRPELGTLEDFQSFTEKAHQLGLKVMADFVLNHTSIEHPWFKRASASRKNTHRDYYLWSKTGAEFGGSSNPFFDLKPSNWIWNEATGDYYFSTFYPQQADLNWDNPEVFDEMMRTVRFWIALGVDAFRLDAASHLVKREGTKSIGLPETHAVLKKIRAHLDKNHPGTMLLAEVHDSTKRSEEYFGAGDECHMAYHFPLVEQLFLAIKRNDISLVERLIEASRGIPESCEWLTFLRHHDEMSLATLTEAERKELIDYFDAPHTHEFGTGITLRLSDLFRGNTREILRAFSMLLAVPGSPLVYYGEEIGSKNIPLPPGEKDTRKALRGAFDWAKAEKERNDPESLVNGIAALIREWKAANAPTPSPEKTAESAVTA